MNKFSNIEAILNKDYDHETPDKPRSAAFNRAFRTVVANAVKEYGYTLLPNKGSPWCESCGFVTDNKGHYVYFNSGDYRFGDWRNRMLIRTAKSESDSCGGCNHYCSLEDVGESIDIMLSRC